MCPHRGAGHGIAWWMDDADFVVFLACEFNHNFFCLLLLQSNYRLVGAWIIGAPMQHCKTLNDAIVYSNVVELHDDIWLESY